MKKILEKNACFKCTVFESKTDILLQEHMSKDREIGQLQNLNYDLKANYAKLKNKYKNFKKCSPTSESVQETASTFQSSKFIGSLLYVVFGTNVLKGTAGCQKVSILNPAAIREI